MTNAVPPPLGLFDGDGTRMISYHRLYDGQGQPGAMLFGRVVRCEQPLRIPLELYPHRVSAMRIST